MIWSRSWGVNSMGASNLTIYCLFVNTILGAQSTCDGLDAAARCRSWGYQHVLGLVGVLAAGLDGKRGVPRHAWMPAI